MPAMDWNYSLNKFTKMCTKCKLEYEGNDPSWLKGAFKYLKKHKGSK